MPIENVTYLVVALEFLTGYLAEKGLDQFLKNLKKIKTPQKEMSIEEHVYCLLTESLEEFCTMHKIEFDENAFLDTLVPSLNQVGSLKYDDSLKHMLESATGLELSQESFLDWVRIVDEHIVSDKHQKLFRAIQWHLIKGNGENIAEPAWMREHMADNFFEIVFEEIGFEEILSDIKTDLSKECWMQTKDLITELALNALQHGNADHFWLHISEKEIALLDNGTPFDTMCLAKEKTELSGGNWTIMRYEKSYPDVEILYSRKENKNETLIRFEEKVFSVNGLCEITLPKRMVRSCADFILRYPNSKARYYYVDFSGFKPGISFLCMSGAFELIYKLNEFCESLDSDVFLFIPFNSITWDDFVEKIDVCMEHRYPIERVHVIRG